jgi:hypothetical protein
MRNTKACAKFQNCDLLIVNSAGSLKVGSAQGSRVMAPENPFVSRSSYRQVSTGRQLSATKFFLSGRFNVRERVRGFIALGLATVGSAEHLVALACLIRKLFDEQLGHGICFQRIAASAKRKDRG